MKTLRFGLVAAAIGFAASALAASPEITDVRIAQRYPWNGLVDITYTVNCDDANKDVWVYPVGYDADTDAGVALMPQYLSGEGVTNAVRQGTHRMVWDMAAQMGKDYNRAAFSVKMHAFCDAAPYMVIDLSAGSEADKYTVSYLPEIPAGGWGEDYKTTKMVFRLILPGQGNQGTLTKPYYFAIYPMTEQQYCLIDGGTTSNPTEWKKEVSYDMLRGTILGSKWPEHQQVDATSVLGKLRLRTGITMDLPTSEQWYRAARADGHTEPISPNAWGIFQLGDALEWNLNWFGNMSGVDPVGPSNNRNNARAASGRLYTYDYDSQSYLNYPVLYCSEKSYRRENSQLGYEFFTSRKTKVRYGYSTNYYTSFRARLVALPVCR